MENIFEFVLSPFGVVFLLVIIAIGLLVYFMALNEKKRAHLLLKHFKGKISPYDGTIQFQYEKFHFYITRISGGGVTGVSSSPSLWCYIDSYPKIIIGSSTSVKYTRGSFLIIPNHKIITINSKEILIGTKDNGLIERIAKVLNENHSILEIFNKNFSHLTIANEYHVQFPFIKKRNVFKYTCLNESIYSNPNELEFVLKQINCLFQNLEINAIPTQSFLVV